VSPVLEATTLGAAFLAGLAVGTWDSLEEAASTWKPARVVEPGAPTDRDRWREASARAERWIPDLSSLSF
jgi:glycerol kinase